MNESQNNELVILKEEEEEEKADFGSIDREMEWNRFEAASWIDVEVKLNEYMWMEVYY